MASYKERILKAIEMSENGMSTIDVARNANVSRTTAIKYLSVLESEGKCEFVEVGPCKLWNTKNDAIGPIGGLNNHDFDKHENSTHHILTQAIQNEKSKDAVIFMSFKVKQDKVGELFNLIKNLNSEEP
jgi:hypothetical protein